MSVIVQKYTVTHKHKDTHPLKEIEKYICVAMVNYPFCLATTPGQIED